MPAGPHLSTLDFPFVCATFSGMIGLTRTFEEAQQHCQQNARMPLSWSRPGRRWVAMDDTTGLKYTIEQLLF